MYDQTAKMRAIAETLDDLNEKGKVKRNPQHEKGYAKALEITRGCALWLHHTLEDKLIVDLMISPTARERQPELCERSQKEFAQYFDSEVSSKPWKHSDGTRVSDRYFFDVTDTNAEQIIAMVEELKRRLSAV